MQYAWFLNHLPLGQHKAVMFLTQWIIISVYNAVPTAKHNVRAASTTTVAAMMSVPSWLIQSGAVQSLNWANDCQGYASIQQSSNGHHDAVATGKHTRANTMLAVCCTLACTTYECAVQCMHPAHAHVAQSSASSTTHLQASINPLHTRAQITKAGVTSTKTTACAQPAHLSHLTPPAGKLLLTQTARW